MAVKNIYGEEEKKKNRYSSNTAAYSSNAALPHTQSAPQNNVWNAEQSTPGQQSYAPQNRKREKSPSELGEEVLRLMLEEDAAEARQPAASATATAPAATAAPAAAPGTKAISGNKKAAQYTGAAASPYTGTAAASYGNPVVGQNAGWNESPSYLQPATYERATPQPFANAMSGEHTFQSARQSNYFTSPQQIFGGITNSTYDTPTWQSLAAAQRYTNAETNANTQFIQNRQLLAAAPGLTSVGPDTDDFRDVAYGDSTFDLTTGAGQSIDPIYTLPNLSYAGAGASTVRDPAFDESVFGTPQSSGEDAVLSSVMTDRLASMSMPDWSSLPPMSEDPALTKMGLQLGLLLKNLTSQHWDNTHFMVNKRVPEIEIQDVKKNPLSGRTDSENDETALKMKALPNEKRSGTLSKEQDSIQHEHKEWWEKPGASESIDPEDPAYQAMNAKLTDNQRAAGLSVVKINGEYYVDVTIMINTRLQEVEQDFRNHFIDFQNSAIDNPELIWAYTTWFISQVKGHGPWDIKDEKSWLRQFGNVLALKDMSETIAYNGQVVRPENLGNLTYGYLGRSMGWPAETLYLAGGIYNQYQLAKDLAEESAKWALKEGQIDPGLIFWFNILKPSAYSDGSYGDGANDTLFVKQGVELYEAVHKEANRRW